jgi:clan AA aspartic protease (TIGR02281 family)
MKRALLLAWTLFILSHALGHARIYRWVDQDGRRHFTNNPAAIPPAYRHQIDELPEALQPESMPPSTPASPASHPASPATPAPQSYRVPLQRIGNAFFVDAVVNDSAKVRLHVDTGATQTVILPKLAERLRLDLDRADILPVETANGVVLTRLTQVRSITVGDATVRDVDVIVHDVELSRSDGLLGMSFLGRFQVTLDTSRNIMILTSLPETNGLEAHGGRSETWWKNQFRFYRHSIARIQEQLQEQSTPELQRTLRFLKDKLSALEHKASLASVPRHWRY